VTKEVEEYRMDILGLGVEIWPDFREVATQNGITFLLSA
jgi:hypothetical protein